MPIAPVLFPARCRLEREADGASRVWLVGEFDIATAPVLDAALRQAQAESERVVVDLRRVVFLDWTCVQTLLVADVCARRSGVPLTIVRPRRAVKRLLALTGAGDRLTIVGDDVDACRPVTASRRRRRRRRRLRSVPGSFKD